MFTAICAQKKSHDKKICGGKLFLAAGNVYHVANIRNHFFHYNLWLLAFVKILEITLSDSQNLKKLAAAGIVLGILYIPLFLILPQTSISMRRDEDKKMHYAYMGKEDATNSKKMNIF